MLLPARLRLADAAAPCGSGSFAVDGCAGVEEQDHNEHDERLVNIIEGRNDGVYLVGRHLRASLRRIVDGSMPRSADAGTILPLFSAIEARMSLRS